MAASLALTLLVLAGCDPSVSCTDNVNLAIVVEVHDASAGGAPLAGATGYMARRAGHPSATDTVAFMPLGEGTLGAFGRSGTYDVRVDREGYSSWGMTGVAVTSSGGDCPKTQTVSLDASLSPDG